MKLAIIAAIASNRVIGAGNSLPWHISEDLKRFKRLTTGHTVIMGRRTWESIGRSLPLRRNIVVSSRKIPGVESYGGLEDALRAVSEEDIVFVIGGGQLYAQALPRAEYLYLTLVKGEFAGDVFFPPYEQVVSTQFKVVVREDHTEYSFIDYERVHDAS